MTPDSEIISVDSEERTSEQAQPEDLDVQSLDAQVKTAAPLPPGILSTGAKPKKRVTFRDSNLVLVREIPPRTCSPDSVSSESGDSNGEDDAAEEEADDSGTSESEVEANSDEEEEEDSDVGRKQKVEVVINKAPAQLTTARNAANQRVPIVWSKTPTFAQKGTLEVSASPAPRVFSLVSHVTGVAAPTLSSRLKSSPPKNAPRKPPPSTKGDRKVRQITPMLDSVLTLQTTGKPGGRQPAEDSPNSGAVKAVRKKRAFPRKPDSSERRRKTSSTRKSREAKHGAAVKVVGGSVSMQTRSNQGNLSVFSRVRDSLSLPSLDSAVSQSARGHQQLSVGKMYTVDGFIFPGDPDLTPGVSVTTATSGEELKGFSYPLGTSPTSRPFSRERVSSASSTSTSRPVRRFHAWQMANGDMQNTIQETPCIAPMWETVHPISFTSRSGSASER